jgi:hypothetical protein
MKPETQINYLKLLNNKLILKHFGDIIFEILILTIIEKL